MPKKNLSRHGRIVVIAAPLARRYGGLVEAHAIKPRRLGQ
jgi:hypothetical protein